MFEVKLNTELPGYLTFIFLRLDLLFRHGLHSTEETSQFVLDDHDFTKLPLAHLLPKTKIVLAKLIRDRRSRRILGSFL